jgi:hypothetical protein
MCTTVVLHPTITCSQEKVFAVGVTQIIAIFTTTPQALSAKHIIPQRLLRFKKAVANQFSKYKLWVLLEETRDFIGLHPKNFEGGK